MLKAMSIIFPGLHVCLCRPLLSDLPTLFERGTVHCLPKLWLMSGPKEVSRAGQAIVDGQEDKERDERLDATLHKRKGRLFASMGKDMERVAHSYRIG